MGLCMSSHGGGWGCTNGVKGLHKVCPPEAQAFLLLIWNGLHMSPGSKRWVYIASPVGCDRSVHALGRAGLLLCFPGLECFVPAGY